MGNAKLSIYEERFDELLDAENKLNALEAAGVDNWEGYDEAMGILQMLEEENG